MPRRYGIRRIIYEVDFDSLVPIDTGHESLGIRIRLAKFMYLELLKIKISSKRSILTHSNFRNICTEYIKGI